MDLFNNPLVQQYGGWALLIIGLFLLFLYMRGEARASNNRVAEIEARYEAAATALRDSLEKRISEVQKERADDLRWFEANNERQALQIATLESRLEKLLTRYEETKLALTQKDLEYQKLEHVNTDMQRVNERLVDENRGAEREKQTLNDRIAGMQGEINVMKEQIRQLQAQLEEKETEIQELRREQKRQTGEMQRHEPGDET